jgi:multicomponent Na+:H+ antiporter subunit B
MNSTARLILFLLGALGIAAVWALTCLHVPGPAQLRDRYLVSITHNTFEQRNITDTVSAVNFDYRGFDTMGEEFILFTAVLGSLVLLRQAEEKKATQIPDAITPGRNVGPSDAMRLWILAMIAPKIAFGVYIVIHGQLTPGGGFQGGVILATVALIIFLGHGFETFNRVMTHPLIEITEASGAAAYILIGMIAWFSSKPFLTNTLPLGKAHELTSGGTIPLISAATGAEVTGGFVLLLYAFLQQLLTVEEEKKEQKK